MNSARAWREVKIRHAKRRGVIFLSRPSKLSVMLSTFSLVFIVLALIAGGVPIVPMVWYRLSPGTVGALGRILKKPPVSFGASLERSGEKQVYQPPLDA